MSIELASASWCKSCSDIKAYLEAKNIEYSVVDIDDNNEYVQNHKLRAVPTIIVDDEVKAVGLEGIKTFVGGL